MATLAACAQRPAATAPQPLVPKNGPEGSVRAEYEGGVFSRRLSAVFSVNRPSYVMVAHLGGDGVIRVLYPEDARETGYVPAKRLFRTDATVADYDAAPGYWFMRPTVYRSVGAQSDSYDGNGHGFVFMISSDEPLRFDEVSEFGLWDEFDLPGYATAQDPRLAIRSFANLVSPNGRYSLDYASSFTSYAVQSYAMNRMDCAMLSSGGFGMAPWSLGYFGMGYSGHRFGGMSSCGRSAYASYAYWQWRMAMAGQSGNDPMTPPVLTPEPPTTPIASPLPVTPRPGRRDPIRPRPEAGMSRPVMAERATDFGGRRDVTTDRRATQAERRATPRTAEPVTRAPSTPQRRTYEGTRTVTDPRAARSTSARPRSESPRPSASPSSGSSTSSSGSSSSGATRSTTTERASPPPKPVVRDP